MLLKILHPLLFLFCITGMLTLLSTAIAATPQKNNPVNQRKGMENIPIGDTICSIVNQLTGKMGRGISSLAIIFLAIGVILGKINWGLAVAVFIAIAAIFGADTLISFIALTDNAPGCKE